VKKIAIHPFIIPIYIVLYYYEGLHVQSNGWEVILVGSACFVLSAMLWVLIQVVTKNIYISAILTSCCLIFMLSFDGIYEKLIDQRSIFTNYRVFLTTIDGQYTIFFMCILIVLVIGFLLKRLNSYQKTISLFLDFVSVILISYLGFQILEKLSKNSTHIASNGNRTQQLWASYSNEFVRGLPKIGEFQEDIYYIILDGYGGKDTIDSLCGVRNYPLSDQLIDYGFYVLDQAKTNYNQTRFSISSSLNFSYIQELAPSLEILKNDTRTPLLLVNNNLMFQYLRSIGYKTVTFWSPIDQTNIVGSDYYIAFSGHPSPFVETIINNSFLSLFFWTNQYQWHVRGITEILNTLSTLSKKQEQFFVYAHLMIPHPPFVFFVRWHD